MLCSAYIFLHQKRLELLDNSERLVERSTPWVVFMDPHKNSPVWLFFSPPNDDFKPLNSDKAI